MGDAFKPAWARTRDEPASTLAWPLSCFHRHADRSRFQLSFCSLQPSREGVREIAGAGLLSLDCRGRRDYPLAVAQLARWLIRERIDVVHTHLFDATFVGLSAARLARVPLAMLTGHHSAESAHQRQGGLYHLDRLLLSRVAHQVVAPCRYMRDIFVSQYHLRPDRVPIIEHGLEGERALASAGGRDRVRSELGLGGKLVIGALGRLSWVKQHAALLDAFAAVASRHPDAVLVIAGFGQDRDQLERQARALGIAARVVWPGPRSDVADFMAAIDLFVHGSVTESFGLALVEAMAAGKPALGTAVGIAPDIVEDGRTGVLVPPGDAAALGAGLARILDLRPRWGEMGQQAARRVSAFTAEKMVARYEGGYLEQLARRRVGRA
jgi:glycosyltransferase involved in cell wall biosynthesis